MRAAILGGLLLATAAWPARGEETAAKPIKLLPDEPVVGEKPLFGDEPTFGEQLRSAGKPAATDEKKPPATASSGASPQAQLNAYDPTVTYLSIGLLCSRRGEFDEAIVYLSHAIELSPNSHLAYLGRGRRLVPKEGLQPGHRGPGRSDPALPNAATLPMAGHGLVRLARLGSGASDADEAVRLSPESAEAHSLRGSLWTKRRALDEALADLDEAVRLEPGSLNIAAVGRGVYFQFRKLVEAAADGRNDPARSARRRKLSFAEHRSDRAARLSGAKDNFDMAIWRNPTSAHICSDAAWELATCPTARIATGRARFNSPRWPANWPNGRKPNTTSSWAPPTPNAATSRRPRCARTRHST